MSDLATATNCHTEAQDYVREKLATLGRFQEFVEVDSEEKALDRVFRNALPAPRDENAYDRDEWEQRLLRHAVVASPTDNPFEINVVANDIRWRGTLDVNLSRSVRDVEDWKAYLCREAHHIRYWENIFGDIFRDLLLAVIADRGPWISKVEASFGLLETERSTWKSKGHIQDGFVRLHWGA